MDTHPRDRASWLGELRECLEPVRELTLTPRVEVGRGCADSDESDVDIHAVARANDVAEEPSVPIDAIGRRLSHKAYARPRRQQRLRRRRRLRPVAVRPEEDLGRVDLHEADALAVAEDDRIAVCHMVDAVHR